MNESKLPDWEIRNAQAGDIPFIYSTWTQSYRYDSPLGRACRNSVFFPEYEKVIDWILDQDDTTVKVAHHPKDSNVIFGYMVCQPNVIHYTFTKQPFFHFGIANSLFVEQGKPKYFTHKTHSIKPILEKHPELIFQPFLLFKQLEPGKETHGSSEEG